MADGFETADARRSESSAVTTETAMGIKLDVGFHLDGRLEDSMADGIEESRGPSMASLHSSSPSADTPCTMTCHKLCLPRLCAARAR